MIIAWQTINAGHHPNSNMFSRGFLVVAPAITIRDRLRVLQPNDPDSYYRHREIVPPDTRAPHAPDREVSMRLQPGAPSARRFPQ